MSTPTQLTLLDIAKANGHDAVVGLIEANANTFPELSRFPARTIKGTSYPTLIRQDYPVTTFRRANEGSAAGVSKYVRSIVECFIIDQQLRMDSKVAQASEDGVAKVLAREASGGMLGAARTIASQIYYGSAVGAGGDVKGFPGLAAQVDAARVFGNGAAAAKSSVFAIRFGDQDVTLVGGQDNGLTMLPEWRFQNVNDANGNPFDAFLNSISGWIGMQMVNPNSVGRINNIGADADAGHTFSDNAYYSLIEQMPANWVPDLVIMNRRSLTQLRKSRTTTLVPTVPMPTDISGVPIMVTDAILNAETI